MMETLFGIENLDKYLVLGILVLFGLLEVMAGALLTSKRKASDWIQEVGSFFVLSALIKPGIVLLIFLIGETVAAEATTLLSTLNFWLLLIIYLLVDDVLQYWYHRLAHQRPFLWKLHRAHHQAEEMGFFVSYRNAGLYYVMMPNIWWIGVFTFLGGGMPVALGLVLKQLVIISSHSTLKWDKPLYKIKVLHPFMYVVERIFITPAFHHAHHGKSRLDAASDPNNNFGNMFSIWDQLFGSAYFTRAFPASYGLVKPIEDSWPSAYFYPLVKSSNKLSELSSNFSKSETATANPISLNLVEGKKYLWCKCGLSKNQPFCDGSHNGTPHKPLLFVAKRTGLVKLCNCKRTAVGPFCDDSHLQINQPE